MVIIYILSIKWTNIEWLTNMKLVQMWETASQPPVFLKVNVKTHVPFQEARSPKFNVQPHRVDGEFY